MCSNDHLNVPSASAVARHGLDEKTVSSQERSSRIAGCAEKISGGAPLERLSNLSRGALLSERKGYTNKVLAVSSHGWCPDWLQIVLDTCCVSSCQKCCERLIE